MRTLCLYALKVASASLFRGYFARMTVPAGDSIPAFLNLDRNPDSFSILARGD
jgi:hypothetical protein